MMNIIKYIINRIRGQQSLEKLKKRGLKIGENCSIMGGVIIDDSHCWHVQIGNNVVLAPKVHILAHDASTKMFIGYTKVRDVKIGNNVFIGAGSIILPGVEIGDNVIIGAGSLVSNSIPSNVVAIGNPAKVFCSLDDYLNKVKLLMNNDNCFDENYTLKSKNFNKKKQLELLDKSALYKTIFLK